MIKIWCETCNPNMLKKNLSCNPIDFYLLLDIINNKIYKQTSGYSQNTINFSNNGWETRTQGKFNTKTIARRHRSEFTFVITHFTYQSRRTNWSYGIVNSTCCLPMLLCFIHQLFRLLIKFWGSQSQIFLFQGAEILFCKIFRKWFQFICCIVHPCKRLDRSQYYIVMQCYNCSKLCIFM